jgi:hypothetical protein
MRYWGLVSVLTVGCSAQPNLDVGQVARPIGSAAMVDAGKQVPASAASQRDSGIGLPLGTGRGDSGKGTSDSGKSPGDSGTIPVASPRASASAAQSVGSADASVAALDAGLCERPDACSECATCSDAGGSCSGSACGDTSSCLSNGSCGCTDGEIQCVGSTPQRCVGNVWVNEPECYGDAPLCSNGACVCADGALRCSGASEREQCLAGSWVTATSCEVPAPACNNGSCCQPGELDCAACDGTAGNWDGCRGHGCAVCVELVAEYPNYFVNHPFCVPNPTCDNSYYTCNEHCPPPSAADL